MTTVARQRFDLEALTEQAPFELDSSASAWITLEWWAAGNAGDDDYARLGVRFLDDDLVVISETYAPGLIIAPADVFVYRSYAVAVPAGARFVDLLQQLVLDEGVTNNGYLDEARATLHRASL